MPKYPCYVVTRGIQPGVYEIWSEVVANTADVKKPCYQGCTSFDEAVRIYKDALAKGHVRVLRDEVPPACILADSTDVPIFRSPANAGAPAAAPAPATPPRGRSHRSTPARGRAGAVPAEASASCPTRGAGSRRANVASIKPERGAQDTPRLRLDIPVHELEARAAPLIAAALSRTLQSFSRPAQAADLSSSDEGEDARTAGDSETSSLAQSSPGSSEPESVSAVSYRPSPRRLQSDMQHTVQSPFSSSSRYHTPGSARNIGAALESPTRRTPTAPRLQGLSSDVYMNERMQGRRVHGSTSDSSGNVARTASSSPQTLETQHEDGDLPFSYQRTDRFRAGTASRSNGLTRGFSYSETTTDSSFGANVTTRRRSPAKTMARTPPPDLDLVPTRPNTPTPVRKSASAPGSSQTLRPRTTMSLDICTTCQQPHPDPPLSAPTLGSAGSSSSSSRRSVKVCTGCYQPLPRLTPLSSTAAGSGLAPMKYIEVDEAPVPPSPRAWHAAGENMTAQLNALGLSGASRPTPGVVDPRSPGSRSDVLSERGSPSRRKLKAAYQPLSSHSF